jgi:hypothetical protein
LTLRLSGSAARVAAFLKTIIARVERIARLPLFIVLPEFTAPALAAAPLVAITIATRVATRISALVAPTVSFVVSVHRVILQTSL